MNAEKLQALLAERREALVSLNGASATEWARLIQQMEAAILRILEGGAQPITEAETARILSGLSKILNAGGRAALAQADRDAISTVRLAFDHQKAYFAAAAGVADITAGGSQVARAFLFYDRRIQSGDFLGGEYWKLKRVEWAREFVDQVRVVTKGVQSRVTSGLLSGITSRDVADGMRDQIGALNLNGRVDPVKFADAFTRTQGGQLYNDMSVSVATQAGVDKFVNIGVSDERQSLECYEASQEPPKTMAEWSVWRASNGGGGRPGERHVMNCRCIAGAVPDALEDDDWTQPNEKYEEATV